MVYSNQMQSGLGAQLAAFDAFLGGFPNIDEMSVDEVFAKLATVEMSAFDVNRFVGWKRSIRAVDIVTALEGDQPLRSVIGFAKRAIDDGAVIADHCVRGVEQGVLASIRSGFTEWFFMFWKRSQPRQLEWMHNIAKEAVSVGQLEILKVVLDEIASEIEEKELKTTCIKLCQIAASQGCMPIVRYLVGERKGVRAQNSDAHDNVVVIAAQNGHVDVLRYLIANHYSPFTFVSRWNGHAAACAAACGQLGAVRYFVEESVYSEELSHQLEMSRIAQRAAPAGMLNVIRYFISEKNGDKLVNRYYIMGLFQFAIQGDSLDVVKYLIEITSVLSSLEPDDHQLYLIMASKRASLTLVHYLLTSGLHPTDKIRPMEGSSEREKRNAKLINSTTRVLVVQAVNL